MVVTGGHDLRLPQFLNICVRKGAGASVSEDQNSLSKEAAGEHVRNR